MDALASPSQASLEWPKRASLSSFSPRRSPAFSAAAAASLLPRSGRLKPELTRAPRGNPARVNQPLTSAVIEKNAQISDGSLFRSRPTEFYGAYWRTIPAVICKMVPAHTGRLEVAPSLLFTII